MLRLVILLPAVITEPLVWYSVRAMFLFSMIREEKTKA